MKDCLCKNKPCTLHAHQLHVARQFAVLNRLIWSLGKFVQQGNINCVSQQMLVDTKDIQIKHKLQHSSVWIYFKRSLLQYTHHL